MPADPRDRYEERLEFQAALEELHKLPEHLRAVVLLNAAVGRHADVAEILGVSRQRVAYLLQQVTVAIQDRAERRAELDRPVASPRSPSASWISAGSGISDACKAVTTFGVGTFFTAVPPVPDGLQAPRTLPTATDGAGGTAVRSSTRSRTTS